MQQGFIKVATAIPKIEVANPLYNVEQINELTDKAYKKGVKLLVFPELCLTGYSCRDLFLTSTLQQAAVKALHIFLEHTISYEMIVIVGLPLRANGKLFNCAVICYEGRILGIVPKQHIPMYNEFYEGRQFSDGQFVEGLTLDDLDADIPFDSSLLFRCRELSDFCFGIELCEDLWTTVPPSSYLAPRGATIICNLSASNDTIGKQDYRRQLVSQQSARTISGYIYANCGPTESTTDIVFSGHSIISENGIILNEHEPFDAQNDLLISEIDVEKLIHDRQKQNTYEVDAPIGETVLFSMHVQTTELTRYVDPHPFVPSFKQELDSRCDSILMIQAHGLCKRMEAAYAQKAVVGISGGLDSALALLVMVRSMEILHRSRKDIIAITMPCFGTTKRTKNNAKILCESLGVDFRDIPISNAVRQHFSDIGHDESVHDVVYENCQARERTQVLMDVANAENGLVVGTGDLSELALGFATYNADHMSMYGVNASVPKTLVRHIVSFYASQEKEKGHMDIANALSDIVNTPVSPELLPAEPDGTIKQKTEEVVGPYELHDFFLYYLLRYGFAPSKVFRLARHAFGNAYPASVILHWLKMFVKRFFSQQYKRSCLPDGPKVGSVSLSPRGDWRMPSDASSKAWMADIESIEL